MIEGLVSYIRFELIKCMFMIMHIVSEFTLIENIVTHKLQSKTVLLVRALHCSVNFNNNEVGARFLIQKESDIDNMKGTYYIQHTAISLVVSSVHTGHYEASSIQT